MTPMEPYSFRKFHDSHWNSHGLVNSNHVSHHCWIQVCMGLVLFLGLGLNKESRKLYHQWFSKLKIERCFSRRHEKSHDVSYSTQNSSKHFSELSTATKVDRDAPPLQSLKIHAPENEADGKGTVSTKPVSKLRKLCSFLFAFPFSALKSAKRKQPLISAPLPSQYILSTSIFESPEPQKPPRPYRSYGHGECITTPPLQQVYFPSSTLAKDFTTYSHNRDPSSLIPNNRDPSTNWYYAQQREAGFPDRAYGSRTYR